MTPDIAEAAALIPDQQACTRRNENNIDELATACGVTETTTGNEEAQSAPLLGWPMAQTRVAIARRAANQAAGRPQDNYNKREWPRGGAA
jgi:hypothetical protein